MKVRENKGIYLSPQYLIAVTNALVKNVPQNSIDTNIILGDTKIKTYLKFVVINVITKVILLEIVTILTKRREDLKPFNKIKDDL